MNIVESELLNIHELGVKKCNVCRHLQSSHVIASWKMLGNSIGVRCMIREILNPGYDRCNCEYFLDCILEEDIQ